MPPLTHASNVLRTYNVTGSEVGALLGEHPYTTPLEIYLRLTSGGTFRKPQTESMRFGSEVEPILSKLAAPNLWPNKIKLNSRTYLHRRVPLCATPDALLLGTDALVEFKLSFSQNRWRNGLPPDIEWQARAQMACTHRRRVYVYVFSGVGHWYIVDRELNRERHMTQAVSAFMRENVYPRIPPSSVVVEPELIEFRERKRVAK